MKIKEIRYSPVRIPLKESLSHARKRFLTTESLILKVQVDDCIGVGECCPRK